MNCVVFRKEKVRAVGLVDVMNFEQPPLLQQLKQRSNTWLQYLFANYYFADKDDIIIDSNKNEHTFTQCSYEYRNSNICSEGCPILTQPQTHSNNNLSFSLLQAPGASSSHEFSASHLNRALLIAGPNQICAVNQANISGPVISDKKLNHNPISNIERLEDKGSLSIRPQYSPLLILSYSLLLFVLISSKNALSCSGFSSFMRHDNFGVIGYNNVSIFI